MSTPTQAPYEIAKYLSDEAKRAALGRYRSKRSHSRKDRRNDAGQCPLGAALTAMGLDATSAPTSYAVARLLSASKLPDPAIQEAAVEFINDWDEGGITDLAAALGVA